jgi:phosphate transport system substrate-binding protein
MSIRLRELALALAASVAALGVIGCGDAHRLHGTHATGAGTLPAALAEGWTRGLRDAAGATVTIRPLDSAGALRAMVAGTTALATIGQPLDDRQMATVQGRGRQIVHIPLVLSPLAVGYVVKQWHHRERDMASGLRFDTATLAVIFRGRIENWVNTRILARNDTPEMPDELIQVCHRSDPAATTGVLSSYLSRRSSWWRQGVGSGEQVVWRVLGGFHIPMFSIRGDAGMVRCLRTESATIGYLDAADAVRNGIPVARIVNREHRFIAPTIAGAQAAAAAIDPPADLRFSALDAPGANAYPITAVRYALVWKDMCRAGVSRAAASAAKAWLDYALGDDGQRTARRLGYAPLPARIRAMARAAVERLRCDGAAID